MDIDRNSLKQNTEAPQPAAVEKVRQQRPPSAAFLELQSNVDKAGDPADKLRLALEFMKEALANSGNPRFEDFWAARRFCIGFFKESLKPATRAELWADYLALSKEAKQLKEMIDEQSAFAVEQIDLAIQGVETDLGRYEELVKVTADLEMPHLELNVGDHIEDYGVLQKELYFLNQLASRINSLRKEVVKTGMRIRLKNQDFLA